ncbi:MAG TPA: DUF5996 family protein [Candidatus Baltobacteraceae bacterium]|jgi:hypothetical protein|nr:DUF5996 family protein [Candidatus Baltobacteraceae bacterium]
MERWPVLRYDEWKDTLETLARWMQIVGKIRLKQEPFVNHWWNVTLQVTARGLSTGVMPYEDGRSFSIEFDFRDHRLVVDDCDGECLSFALEPMSVAEFYARLMRQLQDIGIVVKINKRPNEIPDATPFDRDSAHASYDRAYVERYWQALLQGDRLCKIFRARFVGKASPVHFFWGAFDLAATRFSGRTAPPHPGGFPNMPDWAMREAYSHEVHSVGFWPGGYGLEASFYAYAYPQPQGFESAPVRPPAASWNTAVHEFLLPYEAVRTSNDPDRDVLEFFQSTYEAAATLAHWDRAALERA